MLRNWIVVGGPLMPCKGKWLGVEIQNPGTIWIRILPWGYVAVPFSALCMELSRLRVDSPMEMLRLCSIIFEALMMLTAVALFARKTTRCRQHFIFYMWLWGFVLRPIANSFSDPLWSVSVFMRRLAVMIANLGLQAVLFHKISLWIALLPGFGLMILITRHSWTEVTMISMATAEHQVQFDTFAVSYLILFSVPVGSLSAWRTIRVQPAAEDDLSSFSSADAKSDPQPKRSVVLGKPANSHVTPKNAAISTLHEASEAMQASTPADDAITADLEMPLACDDHSARPPTIDGTQQHASHLAISVLHEEGPAHRNDGHAVQDIDQSAVVTTVRNFFPGYSANHTADIVQLDDIFHVQSTPGGPIVQDVANPERPSQQSSGASSERLSFRRFRYSSDGAVVEWPSQQSSDRPSERRTFRWYRYPSDDVAAEWPSQQSSDSPSERRTFRWFRYPSDDVTAERPSQQSSDSPSERRTFRWFPYPWDDAAAERPSQQSSNPPFESRTFGWFRMLSQADNASEMQHRHTVPEISVNHQAPTVEECRIVAQAPLRNAVTHMIGEDNLAENVLNFVGSNRPSSASPSVGSTGFLHRQYTDLYTLDPQYPLFGGRPRMVEEPIFDELLPTLDDLL